MNWLKIPHDALVFVGDGRKALFLRNEGGAMAPSLKAEKVLEDNNPPTHEQGSDRPGRVAATTWLRSALENADWHDLEEHRFARRAAAEMKQFVQERDVKVIVVVAPPRALAELRNAFHADVKARIAGEISKDLTKLPVGDIAQHLVQI